MTKEIKILEKNEHGQCVKVVNGKRYIISLEEYTQILNEALEDLL